jgi:hypothetical protein
MTLRMNGSTSGYVELDCQATGGNNNIKLPSSNGIANQFLKNGSTAGTLGWSSLVETATGVGIGTGSPGQTLSVVSPSTAQAIGIWNRALDNAYGGIYFKTSDGATDQSSILNARSGTNGSALSFFTKPDGGAVTERLIVDSFGRVLVGSTTAATNLPAGAIQSGSGHSAILNTGSVTAPTLFTSGSLEFNFDGVSGSQRHGRISGNGSTAGGAYAGGLTFEYYAYDGSAYRWYPGIILGSSGNVSIGTTGSEGRITIVGDSCGGYIGAITNQNNSNCNPAHGLIFRAGFSGSASGSNFFSFRRPDDTVLGSISQNGASSVAYNTSSDYRLKENIAPLTGAINRINQLKPSQFNFITEPGKTVDGFIAHEAQAVVPECVTGEKDAVDAEGNPIYQGIDQSKLVPLLTAALQEALAKIETLETSNAALEARLTALEAQS